MQISGLYQAPLQLGQIYSSVSLWMRFNLYVLAFNLGREQQQVQTASPLSTQVVLSHLNTYIFLSSHLFLSISIISTHHPISPLNSNQTIPHQTTISESTILLHSSIHASLSS